MGFLAHSAGHNQWLITAGHALEARRNFQSSDAGNALVGSEYGMRHGGVEHGGDKTTLHHVAGVAVVEGHLKLKYGLGSLYLDGDDFAAQKLDKRRCVFIQSSDDLVGVGQVQWSMPCRGRNSNAKCAAEDDVDQLPGHARELAIVQLDISVQR